MHFPVSAIRSAFCCTCTGLLALAATDAASGQQFVDKTATNFPSPAPLEYTSQCTVGDIDGDGDLDVIFANGSGFSCPVTAQILRFYINNGSGTFADGSAAATGSATFKARGVELGDCDGDGDLDIIVAQDCASPLQLLINSGTNPATFINETALRMPAVNLSSSRAQFADVDNDGDLDIYAVNGGASRFGTAQGVLYLNDGTGHYVNVTATNMPAGTVAEPMDCIFGDIDGDLDLDLRIASRAGTSKIYKNNGAGVFSVAASPADNNCYSYDLGDMDGDGDLDMLGANASAASANSELLLKNNGTGAYTSAAFPTAAIDDNDSKFFDYDNDGDMDLIIASLGSSERIYTNNGTGTYTLTAGLIQAISDSSLDVKVADVNGDGKLDVITAQGESGNFTDRLYLNMTGPADTIAPKIVKTEQVADTLNTSGPYWVRTVVYDGMTSDRGFHDKGITLNYSVDGGPAQQVAMKWVGNSEWRGGIPGQPAGSSIDYFVTAKDFANNLGTGPNRTMHVLHPPCPADIDGNLTVDVDDLFLVINNWGQANVQHDINVQDFEFTPNTVDAKSGDTMQWHWVSGTHTVTSGSPCTPDGKFNNAITSGMSTVTYVIPASFSGEIPFFCIPHCAEGMTGNITVAPFDGDVNGSGLVDIDDLFGVINAWGPCP